MLLVPHPATPPVGIGAVAVAWSMTGPGGIVLKFKVDGSERLELPARRAPGRRDGLWEQTCFEMFVKPKGGRGYFEWNLSPSMEWAVYAFDAYREGRKDLALETPPRIALSATADTFELEAHIDPGAVPADDLAVGFSAVIEEKGGFRSYWALAHATTTPDFHHPDCFALAVAAPDRA